ncbi:hypothetical protein LguiA_010983 [Lonicera macranthoides]
MQSNIYLPNSGGATLKREGGQMSSLICGFFFFLIRKRNRIDKETKQNKEPNS